MREERISSSVHCHVHSSFPFFFLTEEEEAHTRSSLLCGRLILRLQTPPPLSPPPLLSRMGIRLLLHHNQQTIHSFIV
uniref:Uncharacterized protein n=1 Tax=Oryza sativa subsp. japonica TaxID=39947 RepID=Q6K4R4_ORYSJ|nr:hypothetical protein [Oryza sativa Japonica Group]